APRHGAARGALRLLEPARAAAASGRACGARPLAGRRGAGALRPRSGVLLQRVRAGGGCLMPAWLGDWLTGDDLRGALILSGAFLGLIAIAELWRRFGHPKPEHTRKLVHLGGGMACLFFPFLVLSPWVVLAMALPLTI